MYIIVAVKHVIDAEASITVNADNQGIDSSHLPQAMNPFDEVALEEAVKLKRAGLARHVLAVSLGAPAAQATLHNALARGADEALLVEAPKAEPLTVAKALAALAQHRQADLLLLGKQAVDDDSQQTGQMAAALLNWGQAVSVSQLSVDAVQGQIIAECDSDTGSEVLRLPLPAVVTAALHLNTPQVIRVPALMAASQQPISRCTLADLGVVAEKRLQVLSVRAPTPRPPIVFLDSPQAVANIIHDIMAPKKCHTNFDEAAKPPSVQGASSAETTASHLKI